jgi:hypothetical protein
MCISYKFVPKQIIVDVDDHGNNNFKMSMVTSSITTRIFRVCPCAQKFSIITHEVSCILLLDYKFTLPNMATAMKHLYDYRYVEQEIRFHEVYSEFLVIFLQLKERHCWGGSPLNKI